ncbi:MAG: DUF4234 domain-containing protein [Verrucomicrobia bacterium]|nr:DUF4234 domain-containing protein [Verrucomicrobiota bacterium]
MLRTRHPIVVWLLLWPTLGFYAFYWLRTTMLDINTLARREEFAVRRLVWFFAGYLAVFLVLFLLTDLQRREAFAERQMPSMGLFMVCFILAVGWNVAFIRLLFRVVKVIRTLQVDRFGRASISPLVIVLMVFIYFIAIPSVQAEMNKLIRSET